MCEPFSYDIRGHDSTHIECLDQLYNTMDPLVHCQDFCNSYWLHLDLHQGNLRGHYYWCDHVALVNSNFGRFYHY